MSFINDVLPSICFGAGILLVALFLGLWQWFDRRSRDPHPSPEDRDYFRRQDVRRYVGVGVIVALAIFIVAVSSRALADYSNTLLLIVLAIGCVLIAVLLALALLDAIATVRYARREIKSLAKERSKLMLDVIGRPTSSTSGRRPPEKKSETPEM